MGGDIYILYGGQVVFALDADWNCLENFENISTMTFYRSLIMNLAMYSRHLLQQLITVTPEREITCKQEAERTRK